MVKITKALARKMYERGEEVMVVPDRVKPTGLLASWQQNPNARAGDFDKLCNAIHYYNCSPETGMKLVYYAKEV
jgi:hypothetical protein